MLSRHAIGALIACILAMSCVSCGPRMRQQAAIKPYRQAMPSMPAGIVPSSGRLSTLTLMESKSARNPLPATPENLAEGRIYYGYYCAMCHGDKGDGNGPVGESYVPKPTDLASPAVIRLTDGQLYHRMLHGVGHDPVISQTVMPQHRWALVLYVRDLSAP